MNANSQLHQFHAQDELVTLVKRDLRASFSSSLVASITDIMSQLTIMTKLLTSQGLSFEEIKRKLGHIKTNFDQVKLYVRTTLCTILPEEE